MDHPIEPHRRQSLSETEKQRLSDVLLANIREHLSEFEDLLGEIDRWRLEEAFYRFYHDSSKVFVLQKTTEQVVDALGSLSPPGTGLEESFCTIIADGTGKTFRLEDNARWLEVSRPILQAAFHARTFLALLVRYAHELETSPQVLPSGWAAVLELYRLR